MMFEAQTEWIAPDNFPNLSGYKFISIDLETRDPDLKSKGSGSVIGNGEIIGVAVAVDGWCKYYPFGHEGGGNLDKKKIFIEAMEKNGEDISPTTEPRIKLSTINGAKGDERQNTVLMLDIDYNSYNAYQKDPSPEHRLFFVGITRTVENLYLVNPMGEYGYQI